MTCTFSIRGSLWPFALLAAWSAGGLWAADIDWQSYTSEGGRFTAKFPGAVKVVDLTNAIHTHAALPGTNATFDISYRDRQQADANAQASFAYLDRMRTTRCEAMGIKPEGVVKFLFGNRPSCVYNFTLTVEGVPSHFRVWFIVEGRRLYEIAYAYPVEQPQQELGELFFKSFRINPR
jgi:hypothetical protein